MSETAFRVFYNNHPATQEQLQQIDEITVDQARDMVWEARLRLPMFQDEQGGWSGREEYLKPFARVRVEIRVQGSTFVPLIDGPVAGYDKTAHSEPGQSWINLVVHDDSVFLDQHEQLEKFEQKKDDELATEIFKQADQISQPAQVDVTPQAPNTLSPAFMQRGTGMQILRTLARRNGMYVCIRPGKTAGEKSIGEFKQLPTQASDIPDLVLTGEKRNVRSFRLLHNARKSAKFNMAMLSFKDKTITSKSSNLANLDLLGKGTTYAGEDQVATRWLPATLGDTMDLDQAVTAAASQASYALQAKGSVIASSYAGVLQPFQVATVKGVNSELTGTYLITRVTHRLTPLEYTQEFEATRNAVSQASSDHQALSGAGSADLNLCGGIC